MKRVQVRKGTIALVFKNNNYVKTLTAGNYWLGLSTRIYQYDVRKPFNAPVALEILLEDEKLASLLDVIQVLDNEIVLFYNKGVFQEVLTAGTHVYFKSSLNNYTFTRVDTSKIAITENINKAVFSNQKIFPFIRVYQVASFEKAILFVDGKQTEILTSGTYYFWKNNTSIQLEKVDLRQIQVEVSGQEILSKDKTALRVNYFAQYKVVDVEKAILENKQFEKQLYTLIQLALREYIGAYTLDEILENKDSIAEKVAHSVGKKAVALGVKLLDSGMRDIILPGDIKAIMNQVLIAQKKAQANVITRREETASTRSLLNTAKLMEDNNMLFKLKEMEFIEKIAEKVGEISISGSGNVVEQLKTILSK